MEREKPHSDTDSDKHPPDFSFRGCLSNQEVSGCLPSSGTGKTAVVFNGLSPGKLFFHEKQINLLLIRTQISQLIYNIEGMERTVSLRIPEVAFREALANALVHRDWSIGNARIQIAMLEDRIEIISPGGFPEAGSIQRILNYLFFQ